jgi:glycosidase
MTNIPLPNGNGNDYIWVSPPQAASSSGNYNLSYNVNTTTSNAGKYWGDNNATVSVNSNVSFLVSTADVHWVIVSGRKYIFTLKDVASGTNSAGYIFEFTGTPATITSISNSLAMENTPVTVTANMSGSLVSNQAVYVRWSTSSNYSTSTVTQMTGAGSTYTATIPGEPGSTNVYYYCFSSGVTGLTSSNCNPATINATAGNSYLVNGNTPTFILTPTTLTGFTYGYKYGPSLIQSYSFFGVLLTGYPGNITVTAPTDFEISTDSLNFSGTTLNIPYSSATLNATSIYVRLKARLVQASYNSELVTITGGGASANLTCSGSVTSSDPVLSVAPSELTGFGYIAGSGPSLSQHYSVTGNYLTGYPGNITATPGTDFEVSTDNLTFSGSPVSVPYTSGTLSSTKIYFRLKAGLPVGNYNSEPVSISGGGASTLNVTNSGTVTAVGSANQTYWWNDQVFYELFVRSFYDGDGNGIGDFSGLMKKLDYLNSGNPSSTTDLGITAIWLMPIMPSPSYHGYDVTDYKSINQDYGNNAQFKAFLDSAHARGIKVIIDLVLNHTSNQHPWFVNSESGASAAYRNWYIWKTTNPGFNGPWGEQVWYSYGGSYYYGVFTNTMPDLNYYNADVNTAIMGVVDYWLDSVKVDGFRLDGAKYICEDGTVLQDAPETFTFWRTFRTHYKGENPNAMTVGEVWSTTSQVVPYVDGTGLDFCFEFDAASDIISSINSGNPAVIKNQMDNVVTKSYPFLQYGTFLTNHDQVRILSQLNNNINYSKLAASLLLTLPGIPFLYYGEEIGMTSNSDDPSKRTPMQWTNGTNAGFTTGGPWEGINSNFTTNNVQTMSADTNSILSWYKKLIRIREQYTSLRRGTYLPMSCTNSSIYSFGRNYINGNTQEFTIPVHNFSSAIVTNPVLAYSGSTASGCQPGTYDLTNLLTNKDAGQLIIQNDGSMSFTPLVSLAANGTAILYATRNNPLPVDLITFTAAKGDRQVVLNWKTASEINSETFEIERRVTGIESWQNIGEVKGDANSISLKNYFFIDKIGTPGKFDYRLKMIDISGNFKYSSIVNVELTAPQNFGLSQNYPNPFNPTTMINYQIPEAGMVTIEIFAVTGQLIKTLVNENKEAGYYSINVNADGLSSGIYFYKLKSGSFMQTKKMLLLK